MHWEATRSSGPGGQNVNKVASKIELRFDLPGTQALSLEVKERLRSIAGSRLDADGWILVVSQLTRDQSRNLEDALSKLRQLILVALVRPTPRRATRPTRASRERRLDEKRKNAERKQGRRGPDGD
ncbi:MAG TPA: alternative ribosome rescue aminoacyl-tRNA hydrolase ArfB [Pseudomonadota bacterium]|nr:alternative ribosome rescue aminoacyl-tRNA hydrolase ArfB [Pseudomonadota bacterium]